MNTKNEVLSIIMSQPKQFLQEKQFKNKFPELYQEIQSINFPEDFKWTQKLYHFFHDDLELNLGLCPVCGKRCEFKSFNFGYHNHCSIKCAAINPQRKIQIENTCLIKYNKKSYSQTIDFKLKFEETCIKNHGVKNPNQCKKIKEKTKLTNQKRYGCDSPMQNKEIKEKHSQIIYNKYGVNNISQSEEIKKKKEETCIKNHGVKYYVITQEFKEKANKTCEENYGVKNPSQSEEIKKKKEETCIKNHGVKYYTQTTDFAKFHRKRVEYDGLTFDSNWEVKIYQYCKEHDIPCEYQPSITFEYEYEGKKHYYHPDFLINGKLYEVKGDQFFDENGKMINPYDKENDLFEAKHQCMLQNGVIILRGDDIKNLDKIEF